MYCLLFRSNEYSRFDDYDVQVRQLQQEQIAKDKRMEKLKNAESNFDNRVEQVSFFLILSDFNNNNKINYLSNV